MAAIFKGISAVEQIARLAGYSFKIKELSRMVWDGNEPLKITMPLTFTSYANPKLEVEQPIDDLKKIASPRENTAPNDYLKNVVSGAGKTGGKIIKGLKNLGAKAVKAVANEITILEPPGPGLLKQSTVGSGSDKIDIYLGTNVKGGKSYFRLYENVVIQSVQAKYWRDFSPQGYAHRGAANIQFQTMDVWTWDDVDKVRSSIG